VLAPSEERVVLITGARTGLGRGLAAHFLSAGWQVAGCSREPSDLADDRYCHFCTDVSTESDVAKMFRDIRLRYGRLDALINNAGMMSLGPAMLLSAKAVQQVLSVNFLGVFLCAREACALMKRAGVGRIVNITSLAVPLAPAGSSLYSASKAAVEQFTRVLAKEVSAFGITVNALRLPPIADTGMVEKLGVSAVQSTLQRLDLKRMLSGKDVARCIDFLVEERSQLLTGQILSLEEGSIPVPCGDCQEAG
jgi:3-oxoacyl-[acyl-carrier protein] reductase